jgi:DNA-binding transcriptional MerR regulator
MQVKQLAQSARVNADTVRYYTRIGLLNPQRSDSNGYQNYGEKDKKRLSFILSARQLGFSLKDIQKIIGESEKGVSPCSLTRELIQLRLEETEQQFAQVLALRNRMRSAVADWHDKPSKTPSGDMICHLIENFDNKTGESASK